jgi:hypothetical protein
VELGFAVGGWRRARRCAPERGPRIFVVPAKESWWWVTPARSASVTTGGFAAWRAACNQHNRQ